MASTKEEKQQQQQGQQFASEGFDLDAIPADADGEDGGVVLELGGGTTAATASTGALQSAEEKKDERPQQQEAPPPPPSEIDEAEEIKSRGNAAFKAGDYESALRLYGEAIDAVPTNDRNGEKTGPELLEMKDEFDERVREERYRKQREEAERKRGTPTPARPGAEATDGSKAAAAAPGDGGSDSDGDASEDAGGKSEGVEVFRAPPHRHSTNLAVYHSNRAACLLHLNRYDEAVRDADVALMYNPGYAKAHLRRMTAYENTDKIEDALEDARAAQKLDPSNRQIRAHVRRLEKLNEERIEKLKEETMGKLKDLGNSLLSNFGLSLDNFKTEKDPNSGSYNISFSQNN